MSIFAGLSSLGPEDGTVGPGGYHCLVWMSHQTKLWHTTKRSGRQGPTHARPSGTRSRLTIELPSDAALAVGTAGLVKVPEQSGPAS